MCMHSKRMNMRQRRRARPITGLRTWRLALAFFGTAAAYSGFEGAYVQYKASGDIPLILVYGGPICIAFACCWIAYGRWLLQGISRIRSSNRLSKRN